MDIQYKRSLKGKTVLLTGGGGGIGFEAAKTFMDMGAYEIFKTSQVELANTLAMELENTNIYAFTIGPGLVKTETAMESIEIVARNMNMDVDEFYKMNEKHILDAQSAGLGFALSVLNAEKYHGQEISSIQVLNDFKAVSPNNETVAEFNCKDSDIDEVKMYLVKITDTLKKQHSGWKAMNVFERQWVFRDFKKSEETHRYFIAQLLKHKLYSSRSQFIYKPCCLLESST